MSLTVLIIEDEPATAGLFKDALSEDGFEVVIAPDGETGLGAFADARFDAVVVDVLLPRLQGFDLLPRLRKLPGGSDVPVVMVSEGLKGENYAERMEAKHDIAAYLHKPVDPEHLRAILRAETGSSPAASAPVARRRSGSSPDPIQEPAPLAATYQGDLEEVPFARVLGGIFSQRLTGVLMLRTSTVKKLIYVEDGLPVFVKSNRLHECLGRIMVAERLISQEECDRSLERKQAEPHKRQGELLVEMGAISPRNLSYGLELQMQAKLFDAFSWLEGRYQFNDKVRFDGERIDLSLSLPLLIYEGASRAMSTEHIRRDLSFARDWVLVPSRDPAFRYQALQLDPRADRWLERIDGTRSAPELIDCGEMAVADSALVLYSLVCTSWVRVAFGWTGNFPVTPSEDLPISVDDAATAVVADDNGEVTVARAIGPRGLNIPRRIVGPPEVPPDAPRLGAFSLLTPEEDPLGTMDDAEWKSEIDSALDRSWAASIETNALALHTVGEPTSVEAVAAGLPDIDVIIEDPVESQDVFDSQEATTEDIDRNLSDLDAEYARLLQADPLPADFVFSAPDMPMVDAAAGERSVVFRIPELSEWFKAEPLPEELVLEAPVPDVEMRMDSSGGRVASDLIPRGGLDAEEFDADLPEPLPESVVLSSAVPDLVGLPPTEALPESIVFESVPDYYPPDPHGFEGEDTRVEATRITTLNPPAPMASSLAQGLPAPSLSTTAQALLPIGGRSDPAPDADLGAPSAASADAARVEPDEAEELVAAVVDELDRMASVDIEQRAAVPPAGGSEAPAESSSALLVHSRDEVMTMDVTSPLPQGSASIDIVLPDSPVVEPAPQAAFSTPPVPDVEDLFPLASPGDAGAATPEEVFADVEPDVSETAPEPAVANEQADRPLEETVFDPNGVLEDALAEARADGIDAVEIDVELAEEHYAIPDAILESAESMVGAASNDAEVISANDAPAEALQAPEAEAEEQAPLASDGAPVRSEEAFSPAEVDSEERVAALWVASNDDDDESPDERVAEVIATASAADPVEATPEAPVAEEAANDSGAIAAVVDGPTDASETRDDGRGDSVAPGHESIDISVVSMEVALEAPAAVQVAPAGGEVASLPAISVDLPPVIGADKNAERLRTEEQLAERLEHLSGMTHYEVLEVPTKANEAEIQAARARLESQFHPDRWTPDRLTARARRLAEQSTLLVRRSADQLLDPEERLRYDRAIGLAERPRQADPVEAELAFRHGRAAAYAEDFDEAERQLRRAVELGPLDGEYLAALAEVLLRKEQVQEASTSLERAADLSPDSPQVSLALARLHRRQANDEAALDWYGRVVKADPDCHEAREYLAAKDRLFTRKTGIFGW